MLPLSNSMKPLVPESFTHLYHTPWYEHLDAAQRLRYNRLFGARINEQFVLFEEGFVQHLVGRLVKLWPEPEMVRALEGLLLEEARHQAMFTALNQRLLPELYAGRSRFFTRLSALEMQVLDAMTWSGLLLPALLWLLLAMEELTTALSRAVLAAAEQHDLEPAYVHTHRMHLRDEERHVCIDQQILEHVLPRLSSARHSLNAALFRRVWQSILAPRRSTLVVIRQLVAEYPALQRHEKSMLQAIRALPPRHAFPGNLVEPALLPATFAMFARYPAYGLRGAPA